MPTDRFSGLVLGTNLTGTDNADGTITIAASGGGGSVTFHDYVERTTNLVVTATTLGTAQNILPGASVAYDGSTEVWIEAYLPTIDTSSASGQNFYVALFDGSSNIGYFARLVGNTIGGGTNIGARTTVFGRRKLTPSAGSHTYSVRVFTDSTTGTPTARCGTGASGAEVPGYMVIVSY
jgi:hypothetical protein